MENEQNVQSTPAAPNNWKNWAKQNKKWIIIAIVVLLGIFGYHYHNTHISGTYSATDKWTNVTYKATFKGSDVTLKADSSDSYASALTSLFGGSSSSSDTKTTSGSYKISGDNITLNLGKDSYTGSLSSDKKSFTVKIDGDKVDFTNK